MKINLKLSWILQAVHMRNGTLTKTIFQVTLLYIKQSSFRNICSTTIHVDYKSEILFFPNYNG